MSEAFSWRTPKARLFSTPLPEKTRTYKPVSHKELATITLDGISDAGFKLRRQEYNSAKDGLEATARYSIQDIADEDMALEIGWQNSYNKKLSLKFAIGTRIFICDNGCVSGNFGAFKKKHMGDVLDFTPAEIIKSIKGAADIFTRIQKQRDTMKLIEVRSVAKAEIIGRLFLHEQMINSTQLNIIRGEINTPSFDYGAKNSLWELYQHTTYAMKNLHPRLWMESHIAVHDFFNKVLEEKTSIIDVGIASPGIITPTWVDPAQISIIDQINTHDEESI